VRGGIAVNKAHMIRQLGFSPTAGVLINLVYSTAAVVLFCWLAWRWLRLRRGPSPGADDSVLGIEQNRRRGRGTRRSRSGWRG
jgi:hypothetical protein